MPYVQTHSYHCRITTEKALCANVGPSEEKLFSGCASNLQLQKKKTQQNQDWNNTVTELEDENTVRSVFLDSSLSVSESTGVL